MIDLKGCFIGIRWHPKLYLGGVAWGGGELKIRNVILFIKATHAVKDKMR